MRFKKHTEKQVVTMEAPQIFIKSLKVSYNQNSGPKLYHIALFDCAMGLVLGRRACGCSN